MDRASKTVLIVEDNPDNLAIYRTFLEHIGYQVIAARDGVEGIQQAELHLPDLILMDISIPKLNGLQATARLKAKEATARIPIVALTAHALDEDRRRAYDAGCDGYLAKPVPPGQVAQEVERLVGPPGGE